MARSLIAFPIRLGLRGASIAVDGALAVAGHALGIAGRLAEVVTRDGGPDLDIDGSETEPRKTTDPRRRPATDEPRPSRARARKNGPAAEGPASVRPAEAAKTVPVETETDAPTAPVTEPATPTTETDSAPPIAETPAHVSEEPTLVDEVAEAGAEDGAGAEVRVDDPWENYDELTADDVIDRITGASTAVLAAVELYEQTHRRRRTVIEAVEGELRRTGSQGTDPGSSGPPQ